MLACLLFFTCIYKYSNRKLLWNYPNFIEWITFIIFNALKHLENVLQSDNSMIIDCNKKRAIFISKNHSFKNFIFTIQMLFWNSIKIVVVFMDLVFGTWVPNVFQNCIQHGILLAVRIFFNVPRDTHKNLIDESTMFTCTNYVSQ